MMGDALNLSQDSGKQQPVVLMQPLSDVEVSYQYIQMASIDLDQNIPLMEEYDLVTWSILVVISPK